MIFRNILVPVIGTEADEEAIRLGCRLAKKNKGRIWAVYVITVKRSLPLEAEIQSEIQKAFEVVLGTTIPLKCDVKKVVLKTDPVSASDDDKGPSVVEMAQEVFEVSS